MYIMGGYSSSEEVVVTDSKVKKGTSNALYPYCNDVSWPGQIKLRNDVLGDIRKSRKEYKIKPLVPVDSLILIKPRRLQRSVTFVQSPTSSPRSSPIQIPKQNKKKFRRNSRRR